MMFFVNLLSALGNGIYWIITKFFPILVKKFGLLSIKAFTQKTVSALLIAVSLAFWAAFVVFLTTAYNKFSDFLTLISNPSSSSATSGQGGEYLACFFHLMDVSGISSGLNSAFAFTIMILLFSFTQVLYSVAKDTLKHVSDELNKILSVS